MPIDGSELIRAGVGLFTWKQVESLQPKISGVRVVVHVVIPEVPVWNERLSFNAEFRTVNLSVPMRKLPVFVT